MLDKFIEGAILGFLFGGVPLLYKLGKTKKEEAIQKGKIYYGLLGCRVIAFFILGIISADLILLLVFGDSVDGSLALLILFLVALPFTALYITLYIKTFKKKLQKEQLAEDCLPVTIEASAQASQTKASAPTKPAQPSTPVKPARLSTSAKPTASNAAKKYCSHCGKAINPKTKKCTGCGKQYFKGIPWKTIGWIIFGTLCFASYALNVYFITKFLLNN